MKIGIPKEIHPGEQRVATTPDVTARLIKLGYSVSIESGAGINASFSDQAFLDSGAQIAESVDTLWQDADIILKVRAPEKNEVTRLDQNKILASFIWPGQNESLMQDLADSKSTILALDSVPRISRAQKLDALSSMANIGGYRAVIEASHNFGRFLNGQITAAGKVPPAIVMVIGAGVAGLAAIGTASSLGAIIRAFDTRPEVKEQIESMNAEFLELEFEEDDDGAGEGGYAKVMSKAFIEAEMALFAEQAREVDIIITTALIPGKPAPKLITRAMVESMKAGSVVIDMAAEQGGNCELTEQDRIVEHQGVKIIGYSDLPSRMPAQSSQLYATNLFHLLSEMTPDKDGELVVDMEDEVIRGATVVHHGEVTWPPPAPKLSAAPVVKKPVPQPVTPDETESKPGKAWGSLLALALIGASILAIGSVAPVSFMSHFIVFILACFVGWQVIWNVKPALHTPLMSVTNAISGIIVIGALLQIGDSNWLITGLAVIALLVASINVAGGFLVTQRMLKMFSRGDQ